MDLPTLIYSFDLQALWFFNVHLAHKWNDVVFKLWTSEAPWFVLAFFFFLQTAYRRHWQDLKTLLWIGATLGFSDMAAAQIIKPWVARMRPCKVIDWIRIADGCAGSMGFPSNHATNGAAFAVFWLLWKGPRSGGLAVACVFCVGLSRVYLGVHYPSDVLGGFVFGGFIGLVSHAVFSRVMPQAKTRSRRGPSTVN